MKTKNLLSTLWIFLVLNFLFCDVFTLMHAKDLNNLLEGNIGGMAITQEFLLSFAIMMEIPMVMVILSKVLPLKPNKTLNLIAGTLLAIIQGWSLTVGDIALHYWFFSFIEIATCIAILWIARGWKISIAHPSIKKMHSDN